VRRMWFSKAMFEERVGELWLLEQEIKDKGLEGIWEPLVAILVLCSSVLVMVNPKDEKRKGNCVAINTIYIWR